MEDIKSNTYFISEREAFNLLYGYDPLNEEYEMETFEECAVGVLEQETEVSERETV